MSSTSSRIPEFRKRLLDRELLVGTFVKTPSPLVCELLCLTSLDVLCLDTEHAPFGRLDMDACLSMAVATDKPSLVRVGDDSPSQIRNALDSGATGILVPHVTSAEQAEAICRAAHFGEGGRGYAGSTRAASFTKKPMPAHLADSASHTTVIAQIEDPVALSSIEAIAAVGGIDCLFIGRVDLAVAMGTDTSAPEVMHAVETICLAGTAAGKPVGMFTPDLAELSKWRSAGASLFLLGSDQTFIISGAEALAREVRK